MSRPGAASSELSCATDERHDGNLAALVDEQGVELRVEMGDAGVVGEGQGAQHLFDPERRLVGGRLGMLGQPLVERDAGTAIDDHVGPLLVDVAGEHPGEAGMVEPGGAAHGGQPGDDGAGARGRDPRQVQHHLGAGRESSASQVIVASLLPSRRRSR